MKKPMRSVLLMLMTVAVGFVPTVSAQAADPVPAGRSDSKQMVEPAAISLKAAQAPSAAQIMVANATLVQQAINAAVATLPSVLVVPPPPAAPAAVAVTATPPPPVEEECEEDPGYDPEDGLPILFEPDPIEPIPDPEFTPPGQNDVPPPMLAFAPPPPPPIEGKETPPPLFPDEEFPFPDVEDGDIIPLTPPTGTILHPAAGGIIPLPGVTPGPSHPGPINLPPLGNGPPPPPAPVPILINNGPVQIALVSPPAAARRVPPARSSR